MRYVDEFRRAVAKLGFGDACLLTSAWMLGKLTRSRVRLLKYYFTAQPLAAPLAGSLAARGGTGAFTMEWVGADCPAFAEVDRPPQVIAARYAQGARCLLARRDGEFAGFLWVVIGPYDEDEVRARFVLLPAGRTAWDFDVFVADRFRMGRLFTLLWQRAGADLGAEGVATTFSRISAFNRASIAAHRRLGARIVGQAIFLVAGRVQITLSSLGPRFHLSWRRDQVPAITLRDERGAAV